MNNEMQAYGLWPLVIINSLVFIIFAFSFTRPRTGTDWRSFGAFSAFIVALFTEMYGIPLTIYFLSGWVGNLFPNVDLLSHANGHLWYSLLGMEGDPHANPIHILANLLILGSFVVLSMSWNVLYSAHKQRKLATTGIYRYVRHPQYVAFLGIMLGFLLMWPTILTLIMFPILIFMYTRLARREEREVMEEFENEYASYREQTPAFIPNFRRKLVDNVDNNEMQSHKSFLREENNEIYL